MNLKIVIPVMIALSAPSALAFKGSDLIVTINEDKSARHTWMEALNVPYIKAPPRPSYSQGSRGSRNNEYLDSYGCHFPQFDNFCSEKEFYDAMFEVCEPIYDERSSLFGSVHDYSGDYRTLGLVSNEYRRTFVAYSKYRELLAYNESLLLKRDSDHGGYKGAPVMDNYRKAWLSEMKHAEKNLADTIWRTAESLDKLDESEAELKANQSRLNAKKVSQKSSKAVEAQAIKNAEISHKFNGALVKINNERKSTIGELPEMAYDAMGYASVADGKGGTTVKFLSYPSCAVQFYSGRRYVPEFGSPVCIKDLKGRNGGISSRWENKCDTFVKRHGKRAPVRRWLNEINRKNNSAPQVYRDFSLKEIDSSEEEREIDKLSKRYGDKVAAEMRKQSKAVKSNNKNAKKRKELDQKIKSSRSRNAEVLSERASFSATLKEDGSLTDDQRADLLHQYDQKFNIPPMATRLLSHEAKVVRTNLENNMRDAGYTSKQIEREVNKFNEENLL